MENIDQTKLSHLKKVVQSIDKNSNGIDIDVSFEYIMASCFPSIWNNVLEKMNAEYERGVKDGYGIKQENLNLN